jgi:hypothetical protein
MRYRVNRSDYNEAFDLITEDGSVATFYWNERSYVTQYYLSRLTDCNPSKNIWDELSNHESAWKDWDNKPTQDEWVNDALSYLVFPPPPEGWERDDTIWSNVYF